MAVCLEKHDSSSSRPKFERGATAVEYALMVALIAVGIILSVVTLQSKVAKTLRSTASATGTWDVVWSETSGPYTGVTWTGTWVMTQADDGQITGNTTWTDGNAYAVAGQMQSDGTFVLTTPFTAYGYQFRGNVLMGGGSMIATMEWLGGPNPRAATIEFKKRFP